VPVAGHRWGLNSPKSDTATTSPAPPLDFNGLWDSPWGVFTLTQAPAAPDKVFEVKGLYCGGQGSLTGMVDPKTRTMNGTFLDTASVDGTIRFVLQPDGQRIVAHYGYGKEPTGKRSLTLTRKGPLPKR
jgi:hypothetical protein